MGGVGLLGSAVQALSSSSRSFAISLLSKSPALIYAIEKPFVSRHEKAAASIACH